MAKTIIQTIGPLYGEPVNGTVFGRPNGSIYVPNQNSIDLQIPNERLYVRNTGAIINIAVCNSTGLIETVNSAQKMHAVALSQDNANYIQFELAEDSDFDTIIGTRIETAGQFNVHDFYVAVSVSPEYLIVNGTTYYVRALLVSGSGVPVATSETFELTGWASE